MVVTAEFDVINKIFYQKLKQLNSDIEVLCSIKSSNEPYALYLNTKTKLTALLVILAKHQAAMNIFIFDFNNLSKLKKNLSQPED